MLDGILARNDILKACCRLKSSISTKVLHHFNFFDAFLAIFSGKHYYKVVLYVECEISRSPMISYRSLLYGTTILYDERYEHLYKVRHLNPKSWS